VTLGVGDISRFTFHVSTFGSPTFRLVVGGTAHPAVYWHRMTVVGSDSLKGVEKVRIELVCTPAAVTATAREFRGLEIHIVLGGGIERAGGGRWSYWIGPGGELLLLLFLLL
jgi:hypothetical protein